MGFAFILGLELLRLTKSLSESESLKLSLSGSTFHLPTFSPNSMDCLAGCMPLLAPGGCMFGKPPIFGGIMGPLPLDALLFCGGRLVFGGGGILFGGGGNLSMNGGGGKLLFIFCVVGLLNMDWFCKGII